MKSRYGSQALAVGLRLGTETGPESGDTWVVSLAGFESAQKAGRAASEKAASAPKSGDTSLAGFAIGAESGDASLAGFAGWTAAPGTRRPDGDARSLQVASGSLPANSGFFLDAPQRPAQPPQRDDLLSFLFAQDIAHVDGGYPSIAVNVLPQLRWPVFSRPSLAGFEPSPKNRQQKDQGAEKHILPPKKKGGSFLGVFFER